jgi:hypothetical protein
MLRKFMIAGLLMAVLGLFITVTTGVIGQQPGKADKKSVDETSAPPADTVEKTATPAAGAPAASSEGSAAVDKRAPAGSAATSSGDETSETPSTDHFGAPKGKSPKGKGFGNSKARGKMVEEKPRAGGGSGSGSSGAMAPGGMGMPGMAGMPGMGMMPGGGGGMPNMMPGMSGAGGMAVAVSEDEHLETWVSNALAEYAKTEDQNARKEQREQIAKALDRIFDLRQERRMEELETLEQRVQKLRGTLETREKLKSDILKNRLDYLIREADGLGWGDGLPAPGRSLPTGTGSSSGSSSYSRKGPATGGSSGGRSKE